MVIKSLLLDWWIQWVLRLFKGLQEPWNSWKVIQPVIAETVASAGTGVAAETETPDAESAPTTKPNGVENWVGPASSRRDNIGAPAVQNIRPRIS